MSFETEVGDAVHAMTTDAFDRPIVEMPDDFCLHVQPAALGTIAEIDGFLLGNPNLLQRYTYDTTNLWLLKVSLHRSKIVFIKFVIKEMNRRPLALAE